ncbi:MAG TPA: hypothetical protein VD926_01545 [Acidimicrobiales bacterium]|nr:hypothetical protein [Acidimicrobiales bacterium]
MTTPLRGTTTRPRSIGWDRAGPWLLGILLAVLLLGPVLGPGSLLDLDLLVVDPVPVPAGTWGLGPELPRRVPMMIPVAWVGALLGSWLASRALLVAIVAVAAAGMHRLARDLPQPVRYGLAVIYAAGPFLATRLGVGHLNVALAAALLPWALPTLLRPTRSVPATAVAAMALGLTGVTGGTYAALAVLVGLLADRPPLRRAAAAVAVAVTGQLPWLVPGVVVFSQGVDPSSSELFGARIRGVLDLPRVVVGHGFWQDGFQVGFARTDALVVGIVVMALAAVGVRRLPDPWRGRGAVLAALTGAVVVAGAVPGLDDVVADAAGNPVLAPLREGHRILPFVLVWVLLAAGHGATRLAGSGAAGRRPALLVLPVALGLVLAGPGAWGLGRDIRPIDLDDDWDAARDLVEGSPGSVVALPWAQYLDVPEADDRRVHHPAPFVLAADVIVSSDPRLGEPAQERADEREPLVSDLVDEIRDGEEVAGALADLGVRWVLILHAVDWEAYSGLATDPGLTRRIDGDVLDLYEVEEPVGPVVTPDGDRAPDWWVRPLGQVDATGGGTWLNDGAEGWMRGGTALSGDGPGRLRLPAGDGVLWYWPSLVVLVADAVALAVVVALAAKNPRVGRAADYGGGTSREEGLSPC